MDEENAEWQKIKDSGKRYVSEAIINRVVQEVLQSLSKDYDFYNNNRKINEIKSEIIEYIRKKFN